MRNVAHLCTLLAVFLALLPVAVAQADPAPLPKPSQTGSEPVGNQGIVAPLPKPAEKPKAVVHTPATPATPATPDRTQTTPSRPGSTTVTPPRTPTPARSLGGREAPAVVLTSSLSSGGHNEPVSVVTQIVKLMPTPLAIAHEALPGNDVWPPWVLSLLTLLASAEAFLLVRLARARRFRQASEALRAISDL